MLMVLMAAVMMNGGPKEQPGCRNVGCNHHAYTLYPIPTRRPLGLASVERAPRRIVRQRKRARRLTTIASAIFG